MPKQLRVIQFFLSAILFSVLVSFATAQTPIDKFQLFVSKIEYSGVVKLSWMKPQTMNFSIYYLFRSTYPSNPQSFVLVDSTVDMTIEDTLSADSLAGSRKFVYVVVGKSSNGTITYSNTVVVDIPGIPVVGAFRVYAKWDEQVGKVLLSWTKIPHLTFTGYTLYRVTFSGPNSGGMIAGDTIEVKKTSDTAATDTPPTIPGIPKYFGYFVKGKTLNNFIFQSSSYYLAITGKIIRDYVKIISIPITQAQVGVWYSYTIAAVSTDSTAVLRYYLDRKPEGVSVDSTTGVATYMPIRKGWYAARFLVKSNKGGVAVQEFQITIAGGNGVIQGMVTDTSDSAKLIPRVYIEVLKRDANFSQYYNTITDSLGTYRITKLDPGSYYLHAIPLKPGFEDQWYNGKRSPFEATIILIADAPSVAIANMKLRFVPKQLLFTLRGMVHDTSGVPLSSKGTKIFFVPIAFAKNGGDGIRRMFEFGDIDFRLEGNSPFIIKTAVDSIGKYSLKVPQGEYIAFARSNGYTTEFFNGKSDLLSANILRIQKDSSGIDFTLAPLPPIVLGEISGVVKDTIKNVSVRARIIAFRDRWIPGVRDSFKIARSYFTDTDSLGRYSFDELLPGKYILLAVPVSNYAPLFYNVGKQTLRWEHATRITINGNSVTGINFFVKQISDSTRGYTAVFGKVGSKNGGTLSKSAGGIMVPGAIVSASTASGDHVGYGITDADGNYSIIGIAPGKYTIAVDVPGFTSSTTLQANPTYDINGFPIVINGVLFIIDAITNVVEEHTQNVPAEFLLQQNFPNPFNPTTTIRFSISSEEATMLKVYDVLGREVQTLVNEPLKAGNYSVRFDASRFSSGVYFYRLQTGNFVETKKMLLTK